MAGAPKGSKNCEKLSTPELRREAYEDFCAHVAKGKNKSSWYFKHEYAGVGYRRLQAYLKEYAHEFDPEELEVALAKGYQKWETIVEEAAQGNNKDANPACLQMVMRNKFGWDKPDHRVNLEAEANIIEMHDKVLKQIKIYQEERKVPVELEYDAGRSEDDRDEDLLDG